MPLPTPVPRSRRTRLALCLVAAATVAAVGTTGGLTSAAKADGTGNYRVNDYADGRIDSILPPGENGLVTATDALQAETTGTRPAASDDQLAKYTNLIYGAPTLTDATLGQFYDDESFGVQAADITRTETPETGVTIYRDGHDVPHIYGDSDATMSFGAGYAQAEDRLFLMDVLRNYGKGTLSAFIGPSCADEQMDHDELLLAPYTDAQAQAQIDALPGEYGTEGTLAVAAINNYVAGVNAWIAKATSDPNSLDADYVAAVGPPQPWKATDVVAIAGLIGGIFGKGGGSEFANSGLYSYLTKNLGATAGAQAFSDLKDADDPDAPTTIVDKTFPYEHSGTVDPTTTAIPDDPSAALVGGPTDTTVGCDLQDPTSLAGTSTAQARSTTIVSSLAELPKHMSNALVVNGSHTTDGHPIAVFGPQVSYFAPEILAIEDLHSPDYDAAGASFPGTGLVELGRGRDFAWSATSAGSDLIDQRLEQTCVPGGGTPSDTQPDYLFNGTCVPMTHEVFSETALPKPGGTGLPAQINHDIYLTQHGVVQGWTKAGGKPVAVVNQRSTYNHDIDSVVGFLRWGQPALTYDAASWMQGAAMIDYTFNWFYVDDRDTAYYTSGLDPVRPANVDPALPTWGTGNAEWQGYLAAASHPHEINPPQGFFVSWNNKPAPGFSAADDMFGYGPVYRSQMLTAQLQKQFAANNNRLTRAQVVQAMSTASTQDLDGLTVLPELLSYLDSTQRTEPANVQQVLAILRSWVASGAHRVRAQQGDPQYRDAAAVATMDELEDQLIQSLFDPLLAAGGKAGSTSTGGAVTPAYSVLPMQWVNTPNSGGAHLGSAYDSGYESYLVKILRQLQGQPVSAPFGSAVTAHLCSTTGATTGTSACGSAIDAALATTVTNLVAANGGSTDPTTWTASPALVADRTTSNNANETMPEYDAIVLRPLGVVAQPNQDWENRPTFQQVVSFPRHRPRTDTTAPVLSTTTTSTTTTSKAPAKTTTKKSPTRKAAAAAPKQPTRTLAYTGLPGFLGWGALVLTAAGVLLLRRRPAGRR